MSEPFVKQFQDALATQSRVIGALILRDMRTRFGRTFFGYVITVAWPLSHLLLVLCIYLVIRRFAPIGANPTIFFATGILPYILCLYPARMMMMSLQQNQPLLYFPIVKSFDVILARGILEIITSFWVIAIFAFILFSAGIDFMPIWPEQAMLAIFATLYLGFSIGFSSAVLYKAFRPMIIIQIGLMVIMYATCGAFFLPSLLPHRIQEIISWNPLLHSVEWLRMAYYDGYGSSLFNRDYLLWFATINLFLGMVLERAIRGLVLRV